jgi:hypothetical protein
MRIVEFCALMAMLGRKGIHIPLNMRLCQSLEKNMKPGQPNCVCDSVYFGGACNTLTAIPLVYFVLLTLSWPSTNMVAWTDVPWMCILG